MTENSADRPAGYRIRHTMLRVRDLERSVDFYSRLLGMAVMRRRENASERVAYVGYGDEDSDHALELVEPRGRQGGFELGDAYGHVALGVPDLYALSERLDREAVTFTTPPRPLRPGSANLVAFITDPDGYEIELTERH